MKTAGLLWFVVLLVLFQFKEVVESATAVVVGCLSLRRWLKVSGVCEVD